jgi:hypothetical protein
MVRSSGAVGACYGLYDRVSAVFTSRAVHGVVHIAELASITLCARALRGSVRAGHARWGGAGRWAWSRTERRLRRRRSRGVLGGTLSVGLAAVPGERIVATGNAVILGYAAAKLHAVSYRA